MKKFLVIYIFLSIVFLGIVYLLTVLDVTQERTNTVYKAITSEVVATREVDNFLKFQSLGYKLIDTYQTDAYDIFVHQTLARREETYVNQLSVIVIPRIAVTHAISVDDESDNTSIVLFDIENNQTLFDSLDHPIDYDYAVSYGIFLYDLYNYAIILNEDVHVRMTLFDYNQNEIIQTSFQFEHTPFNQSDEIPEGYDLGYTLAEIGQLLDIDLYLRRALRVNISIFMVLNFAFGGSLYMFIKQRKARKADILKR